jgi:methylthioribose-1-phosphate isomerase
MADETDRTPGAAPSDGGPGQADAVDLGRRRFFRHFASDLIQTAATVVGAASAIQRTTAEAASAILDPAGTAVRVTADGEAPPSAVFRTAFRMGDESLILVDQRKLPEVVVEYECLTAADTAHAIRERVVRGAPVLGQVAALGLAVAAHRMRAAKPYARRATIRGSANALINARPASITVRGAVERMLARYEAIGDLDENGDAIDRELRAEADAIVFEALVAHGRIAEHGLTFLPDATDRPLRILTIGNSGVLAGGQYGTALGIVTAAAAGGREVHVHVCETRPYLQGARLTTWELQNAGIDYTLIADSAAGGLFARGDVDLVLVGADRVAADGDVAAVIGTYALAVLADRHHVPFAVCAPLSTVDLAATAGTDLQIEERPRSELLLVRETRIAPPGIHASNVLTDVIPASLVASIVTEEGVLRAPYGKAIEEALDAARRRSVPPPPFEGFVADADRGVSPAADASAADASAAEPPVGIEVPG